MAEAKKSKGKNVGVTITTLHPKDLEHNTMMDAIAEGLRGSYWFNQEVSPSIIPTLIPESLPILERVEEDEAVVIKSPKKAHNVKADSAGKQSSEVNIDLNTNIVEVNGVMEN